MSVVENSKKTTKRTNNGNGFPKGKSGNPGGRPKRTQQQKDALQKIKALAPQAAEVMQEMLHSEDTPQSVKVKLVEIILQRTYGKAEATVNVRTGDFKALDAIDYGRKKKG